MRSTATFLLFILLVFPPAAEAQFGMYAEKGLGISVGASTAAYADLRLAAGPVLHPSFEFGVGAVLKTELLDPVDHRTLHRPLFFAQPTE